MTGRALSVLLLLLAVLPLVVTAAPRAQAPAAPGSLYERFVQIVADPDRRVLFGLPADRYWKSQKPIRMTVVANDRGTLLPVLRSWAAVFQDATGQRFTAASAVLGEDPSAAAAYAERQRPAVLFMVGPRNALTRLALERGLPVEMANRFEQAVWPMMFAFTREQEQRGLVLVADDQNDQAIETLMILALAWSLGAPTLGQELHGVVEANLGRPALTDFGRELFRLLYSPELGHDMPLAEALERARQLTNGR